MKKFYGNVQMATVHVSLLANNASSMTSTLLVVVMLKLFAPLLDSFAHMLVQKAELGHISRVVMTRLIHRQSHYKVFIISKGQQVATKPGKIDLWHLESPCCYGDKINFLGHFWPRSFRWLNFQCIPTENTSETHPHTQRLPSTHTVKAEHHTLCSLSSATYVLIEGKRCGQGRFWA